MANQRGMKQLRLWEKELAALDKRKLGVTDSVIEAMAVFLASQQDTEVQLPLSAKGASAEGRTEAFKEHLRSINSRVAEIKTGSS